MNEIINEKNYIKKFEIIKKISKTTKREYYVLSVTSVADKSVELFLSESQFEMMKIVGAENCKVNIEPRVTKEGKNYDVIALRIEDDVLITKDGCVNLSCNIIKEVADIEAFFKKNNKYN